MMRRELLCALACDLTNDGIGSALSNEVLLRRDLDDYLIAGVGLLRD